MTPRRRQIRREQFARPVAERAVSRRGDGALPRDGATQRCDTCTQRHRVRSAHKRQRAQQFDTERQHVEAHRTTRAVEHADTQRHGSQRVELGVATATAHQTCSHRRQCLLQRTAVQLHHGGHGRRNHCFTTMVRATHNLKVQ